MNISSTRFCQLLLLASLLISILGAGVQAGNKLPLKTGDKVYVITKDKNKDDIVRFDGSIKNGFVTGIENQTLLIGNEWEIRLDRVVKLDGNQVTFPLVGARYDSTSRSVYGLDESGQEIIVSVTEIDHVEIMWRIKEKIVPTTISARMLHRRLRFANSYPEVTHQIPLDSIRELKKWKKGRSTFTFLGVVVGGVVGYHIGGNERENMLDTLVHLVPDGITKILSTAVGAVAGGVLGHLVGKGGWKKVRVEKMRVSLSPIYNDGFGLKLAVNF